MNGISYALLAAVGFGFYNFFVSKTGGKITPFAATLFLSLTAAAIALVVSLFQKYAGGKIEITSEGVKYALLAGASTGVAEIFYFFTFTKNPNISIILPIVFTATVITGVFLGVSFNHESLTTTKVIGIGLGLLALFFLAK